MKLQSLLLFVSLGVSVAFVGYASDTAEDVQLDPTVQLHPDETSLEKRVLSRWDSLIAKDFTQAYEYFSPAYRNLFPLEHYLRETGTNVDWVSVDIINSSVDGNRAEVKILLNYRVNLPPAAGFSMIDAVGLINEHITEIWLWKNKNWWYNNPNEAGL